MAPINVEWQAPSSVDLGKDCEIVFSFTPLINAPKTTAKITLPAGVELIGGDLTWSGDIAANKTIKMPVSIRIAAPGEYTIGATAVSEGGSYTFGKPARLFLSAGSGGVTFNRTQKTVAPVIGEKLMAVPVDIKAPAAASKEEPTAGLVTAYGNVYYQRYEDGLWQPARFLQVVLWDKDYSSPDELEALTLTDGNGYFQFDSISNSDEDEGGRLDLYVTLVCENGNVRVVHPSQGVYWGSSDVIADAPDGTVNFGSLGINGFNAGAFEIYDYLNSAYLYHYFIVGYNPLDVTCTWPASKTYENGGDIWLVDGDQMDRDVIVHEYSHAIMEASYGGEWPPAATGAHTWEGHVSQGMAWTEGWATYNALTVFGDPNYDDTVDQTIHTNVENAPGGGEWDGGGIGRDTESAVCAALWDIYDSNNDNQDTISRGPVTIFNVMRNYTVNGHHVYSIHDFWHGWYMSGGGYFLEMLSIWAEHCINVMNVQGDYDDDGMSEINCYYNGTWYLDYNGNGAWNGTAFNDKLYSFGNSSMKPVSGDWDTNGKTEIGAYLNGTWYLDYNGNGVWNGAAGGDRLYSFGNSSMKPVTGDWNKDGKTEIGAFLNGTWYLDYNNNGAWNGTAGGDRQYTFGNGTMKPVTGDWNNDGKTEIGAFLNGTWYLDYNGNGAWNGTAGGDKQYTFGNGTMKPVTGDWNGDGKTEIGAYLNGTWYLDYNGTGVWGGVAGGDKQYSFGNASMTPVGGAAY